MYKFGRSRCIKNVLSSSGLSLPEIIVASGILAFALSGLIALFVNCSNLNEANRNTSLAATHAQFIMEAIRDLPKQNIQSAIENGAYSWNASDLTAQGLSPLRNETIITTANNLPPLQVTVIVSWQDRIGRNRTLPLTTLFQ